MKILSRMFVACCFLLFTIQFSFAQTRTKVSINNNWLFCKGDTLKGDWQKISFPHTWNVEDVMDDEKGYYRGDGWYKKIIYTQPGWKDKNVLLYFEGSNQVTDVYVNGKKAGNHIGGYTAFSFPIKDLLSFKDSSATENEIVIRVNNRHNENIPPLAADFTFYGGIYRDVYLITTTPVHFDAANHASSGIFISTPNVSEAKSDVQIKGKIVNTSLATQDLILQNNILDVTGKIIATKQSSLQIRKGHFNDFTQTIFSVSNLHLWSPDSPYLYTVVSSIIDKKTKTVLDEITNPLGFRWFRFDANAGFSLNGKPLKLIGANRHQDYKGLGNALPDELHVRDIELLKEMGANFIRISHYPQDPSVLQACDRLGILASEEIPIVNQITETDSFTNNCLNMQREMIRQHYNHPCVIIWAYMNEVLIALRHAEKSTERETYLKNVAALAQKLENLSRQEDSSRYTMIVNHGNWDIYNRVGLTKIPKIVGWNLYQGWYGGKLEDFGKFLDRHHQELPDKPLIVTEYGADADARLHSLSPTIFDKTIEYANSFHQAYWQAIRERPFVSGCAIWNLVEFNSEGRAEATPHMNTKGITTADRQPKDPYYFYSAQWLKAPYLKIGSRNWNRRIGVAKSDNNLVCEQPVEIYTNQLLLTAAVNGKVLKITPVEKGVATVIVPFTNGKNELVVRSGNLEDRIIIDFQLLPQTLNSQELPFKSLHVSLGDKRYFMDDKTPSLWVPEQPYTKGSWGYVGGEVFTLKNNLTKYGSNKNILGTSYDAIYETQRVGLDSFKLDVPDGNYEVILHFAELLSDKEREALVYNLGAKEAKENFTERTFDLFINEYFIQRLSNTTYLVPETAYQLKSTIRVAGNKGITVTFKPIKGQTILNGIEVIKQ